MSGTFVVVRRQIVLVNDIRQMLRDVEPESCLDRIFFMSMFNEIEWDRKGFKEEASAMLS